MASRTRESTVLMIGETLLILQKFEHYLSAVLLSIVTPSEADQRLQKALLRDKETLGRLLRHFAERVDLPEHFDQTLDDLLERRNVFVHNLVMAPWFDLKSERGCVTLDEYMREIRSAAKIALHVMIAVSVKRPAVGLSDEVQERIDRILSRIRNTAEPYFGELTEAQYVEKVVTNAIQNYSCNPRET
ncbi:hypothetical protein [Steroidobacter cummioxidans]|uniref:hypothetical protein n=1 Tax=Steroidobacter cummioxidans TaxID=1803913 RepID=UPI000E323BBC|nr:hypothetical protein [Steroidobacter cummioxidans]